MPPGRHTRLEILAGVRTFRVGSDKMQVWLGADAQANKHPVLESQAALHQINPKTAAVFSRRSPTSEWTIASKVGGGNVFLVDACGRKVVLEPKAQAIPVVHGMRFRLLDQMKCTEYQVVLGEEEARATLPLLKRPVLRDARVDLLLSDDVRARWEKSMDSMVRAENADRDKLRTTPFPVWVEIVEGVPAVPAKQQKAGSSKRKASDTCH